MCDLAPRVGRASGRAVRAFLAQAPCVCFGGAEVSREERGSSVGHSSAGQRGGPPAWKVILQSMREVDEEKKREKKKQEEENSEGPRRAQAMGSA